MPVLAMMYITFLLIFLKNMVVCCKNSIFAVDFEHIT